MTIEYTTNKRDMKMLFKQFIVSVNRSLRDLVFLQEDSKESRITISLNNTLSLIAKECKAEGGNLDYIRLKYSLWKVLFYIIYNQSVISQLPLGESLHLRKEITGLKPFTIEIQHKKDGSWRLFIFEKMKLTKFKASGATKKAKHVLILDQDHWKRDIDLTVSEHVDKFLKIEFQYDLEQVKLKFENATKPEITIVPAGDYFNLIYIFKKNETIQNKFEFSNYPEILAAMEEKNDDEKYIKLNSLEVRKIIFNLIGQHNKAYENEIMIKTKLYELEKECEFASRAKQYTTAISDMEVVSTYISKNSVIIHHLIATQATDFDTLKENIRKISFENIILLTYSAWHGLNAIHKAGLIHQDLKRANLLCEEIKDGYLETKIHDFGITNVVVDGEQKDKIAFATAGFLAPEPYLAYQKLVAMREYYTDPKFMDYYRHHFQTYPAFNSKVRDLVSARKFNYIPDIRPHQGNDIWQMAVILKTLLREFLITQVADDKEKEILKQKDLIRNILKELNKQIELPREERNNSEQFMEQILVLLEVYEKDSSRQKITEIIKNRYDEFKFQIRVISEEKEDKVNLEKGKLITAEDIDEKTAAKKITKSEIISQLILPEVKSAWRISYKLEKLKEYQRTIEIEREKCEFDFSARLFKLPFYSKKNKLDIVRKLISQLEKELIEQDYKESRKTIEENSKFFGLFSNGRLKPIIEGISYIFDTDLEPDLNKIENPSDSMFFF